MSMMILLLFGKKSEAFWIFDCSIGYSGMGPVPSYPGFDLCGSVGYSFFYEKTGFIRSLDVSLQLGISENYIPYTQDYFQSTFIGPAVKLNLPYFFIGYGIGYAKVDHFTPDTSTLVITTSQYGSSTDFGTKTVASFENAVMKFSTGFRIEIKKVESGLFVEYSTMLTTGIYSIIMGPYLKYTFGK